MVFHACITASLRCKKCGKLNIKDISYFEVRNSKGKSINCQCGEALVKVRSSDLRTFHILISCLACNKEHLYVLKWKSIPFKKVKILNCPETMHDIAFVGGGCLVRSLAAGEQRDLIELFNSI